MAIELSNLTFTNKADIIPQSGTEQIINTGIANTLDGSDIIIGNSTSTNFNNIGINNYFGSIETGKGNDTIIGTATGGLGYGIQNYRFDATIDTGAGNDTIEAQGSTYGIYNFGTINTSAGNDKIAATGGDTGIVNSGTIDTGAGKDIITGIATGGGGIGGIFNNIDGKIDTGDGNDIITGIGRIGIYNDGIIDTGAGNDIVDALYGGFGGIGVTRLGDGNDLLKGFGSGSFNGGSGKDVLELSTGNYTVGISGSTVSFTSNGLTMNTSEFDKLIAGCATYNFTGLTDGQTITVV
jgi:hypothetical protein